MLGLGLWNIPERPPGIRPHGALPPHLLARLCQVPRMVRPVTAIYRMAQLSTPLGLRLLTVGQGGAKRGQWPTPAPPTASRPLQGTWVSSAGICSVAERLSSPGGRTPHIAAQAREEA